jgi:hypothetical protein
MADTSHASFIFEMTGAPEKRENFIDLKRPLGLVDVSRTGVLQSPAGRRRCENHSPPVIPAKAGTQPPRVCAANDSL